MTARPLRVYVAAPYPLAWHVLDVQRELRQRGMAPTSTWAIHAPDAPYEIFDRSRSEYQARASQNDREIDAADALLVIARHGQGGEMFVEIGRALFSSTPKPIYWTGERKILSTLRRPVHDCGTLDVAYAQLEVLARTLAHADLLDHAALTIRYPSLASSDVPFQLADAAVRFAAQLQHAAVHGETDSFRAAARRLASYVPLELDGVREALLELHAAERARTARPITGAADAHRTAERRHVDALHSIYNHAQRLARAGSGA